MKLRHVIAGVAILMMTGCGDGTGVAEPSPAVLAGPPPKPPNTDAMQPTSKSKRAAKGKVPRGFGGPPSIPKH